MDELSPEAKRALTLFMWDFPEYIGVYCVKQDKSVAVLGENGLLIRPPEATTKAKITRRSKREPGEKKSEIADQIRDLLLNIKPGESKLLRPDEIRHSQTHKPHDFERVKNMITGALTKGNFKGKWEEGTCAYVTSHHPLTKEQCVRVIRLESPRIARLAPEAEAVPEPAPAAPTLAVVEQGSKPKLVSTETHDIRGADASYKFATPITSKKE